MRFFIVFICLLSTSPLVSFSQSEENQIQAALQASPEAGREAATVYGYNSNGKVILLRKGTGTMVCIGDDPTQKGFSISCYHKDLDSFMERGRALKAQGKTQDEIFAIRDEEVKNGKLFMPEQPTTLYVLSGADASYDPVSKTVVNGHLRYVVYIPFATAESTGLPLAPRVPGEPWIMDPGTHRAHIMITPPKK